jgi:hypothetical protein
MSHTEQDDTIAVNQKIPVKAKMIMMISMKQSFSDTWLTCIAILLDDTWIPFSPLLTWLWQSEKFAKMEPLCPTSCTMCISYSSWVFSFRKSSIFL